MLCSAMIVVGTDAGHVTIRVGSLKTTRKVGSVIAAVVATLSHQRSLRSTARIGVPWMTYDVINYPAPATLGRFFFLFRQLGGTYSVTAKQ